MCEKSSRLARERHNKQFQTFTQSLLPPHSNFKLNSPHRAIEGNINDFWTKLKRKKLVQGFIEKVITNISQPLHKVYSLRLQSSSSIVFSQTQAVEVNNHNFWSNVFGQKLFQAFLQNVMTIISKPLHEVLHIRSSSSIVFSPFHTAVEVNKTIYAPLCWGKVISRFARGCHKKHFSAFKLSPLHPY